MRRLIVMASLLALVATACKIETNIGAVINADGSGTIVTEIGMDEEAKGFLGDADPFEGNELSDCEGARTDEEQRGDMTYYILECDVADITEFENAMTSSADTMLTSFDITVTDTLVSVSGTASAEDALGSEAEGFDPALLEDSISANLKITLPGRILEHNADSQSGNTLTWNIPIFGGTLDVSASSNPSGTPTGGGGGDGGFPTWLIAVIAVVVLGGGYYLWTQNKKKGGAAPADTPPPAPSA